MVLAPHCPATDRGRISNVPFQATASLANLLDMPDDHALESRIRVDENKRCSGLVAPVGKRHQDGSIRGILACMHASSEQHGEPEQLFGLIPPTQTWLGTARKEPSSVTPSGMAMLPLKRYEPGGA